MPNNSKNKAIHAKHYSKENQKGILHSFAKKVVKKDFRGEKHKKINESVDKWAA